MKDIEGFPYKVSSIGEVVNKNNRPLKHAITSTEYHQVVLYINNVRHARYVHRLVARAYIPNPDNKPFINHIDFDKNNNHFSNLEWCTSAENNQHSSKLDQMQVDVIREAITEGCKQTELARYFNMSRSGIGSIHKNLRWL